MPGADRHRDLGFAEQPGWLRLGIMMAGARWLDGQARTCPHNPTAERPEPVHLALWLPDLVVCGECTHPALDARESKLLWMRNR
jgi:hypothetical protein